MLKKNFLMPPAARGTLFEKTAPKDNGARKRHPNKEIQVNMGKTKLKLKLFESLFNTFKEDLKDALQNFIKYNEYLSHHPLDEDELLVIIFDGFL